MIENSITLPKLEKGSLYALAGATAMGKSNLMQYWAAVLVADKQAVVYVSLSRADMQIKDQVENQLESDLQKHFIENVKIVNPVYAKQKEYFAFLDGLVCNSKIDILFIETDLQTLCAKKLKQFAEKNNIAIVVETKIKTPKKVKEDDCPQYHELTDKKIFFFADCIFAMHRKSYYGFEEDECLVYLFELKNRWRTKEMYEFSYNKINKNIKN